MGITFVPNVNFSSVGLGVSSLFIGFALFRYRYLEVNPVAREKILDSMSDGIMVIDYNYRLLDLNYAAKELLGIDEIIIGKIANEVLPKEIVDFLFPLLNSDDCTLHILHYENKVFDMRISPLAEIGGAKSGFLIMFHDITEREILHQEIKERSKLDPLTQIMNRRELFEQIDEERALVKKRGTTLSILMMDIDHFKMINDTYGHEAGDRAIEKLVELVVQVIGRNQIYGRYGGDEFVIALKETSNAEALKIAKEIHSTVELTPIISRNATFKIHLSIGVVSVGGEGNFTPPESSDALVALADSALYKAKEEGRNTVVSLSMESGSSYQI
jgi:diguanylate cyclase (GGDEF)-like protein